MATINGSNFNDNNTFNGVPFAFRPALNGIVDPVFVFPGLLIPDAADTINGLNGNDILNALGTNDTLNGGAGNDTLNGGAGNDSLDGGSGNDSLNGGVGNDIFKGSQGNDNINGGDGFDTADYSQLGQRITLSGIGTIEKAVGLGQDQLFKVEKIIANANVANNTIDASQSLPGVSITVNLQNQSLTANNVPFLGALPFTVVNFDNVIGTNANDSITGDNQNNQLSGGGGNDTINGGAGADSTNGGSGNDRIIDTDFVNFDVHNGGTGVDTIDYSGVTFGSGVTINLATGLTSVLNGNTETILNFENVEGSQGGETIIGSSGNNVLNGNGGNDTINGGAGVDSTNGGSGNDRIIDTDFVTFDVHNGGTGVDTIDYSGVSFVSGVTINLATGLTSVLNGNTETILNFENAEGSQGGETIIGSSGNNVLNGNGGNDTINGGAGVDSTNGGSGNDRIIDTDFVTFDVHNGGTGVDTIDYSGVSFGSGVTINLATGLTSVLNGNTETILNFENVEGSQGGETIIGSSGNNVLNGNGGNDTINGGSGNDTINGGSGNDAIVGGSGTDRLTGGLGNDIFDFNSLFDSQPGLARDVITDFAGNGIFAGDQIDLSTIDANSIAGGNQAFTFIGAGAFSAVGQVRYSGGILQANTNFDFAAEFEVQLAGAPGLVASDIIL
ncbi:beta strand repeat-containing protein [Nostoc sp. CALU 1950]|uniref:beta strand repeat-containing protein n=1 Tax=Nostoc sp. CALU 1950 TaxID=3104321 RepID=UPI003EB99833